MSEWLYRYEPVAFDLLYDHTVPIAPGTVVRKVQPHGCPRNGTMGQTYIETEAGEFVGMRCTNSLTLIRRG